MNDLLREDKVLIRETPDHLVVSRLDDPSAVLGYVLVVRLRTALVRPGGLRARPRPEATPLPEGLRGYVLTEGGQHFVALSGTTLEELEALVADVRKACTVREVLVEGSVRYAQRRTVFHLLVSDVPVLTRALLADAGL